MRLRYLKIVNFRGIRHCEWWIDTPFTCLVGPGDSTKTTMLDAIGLVLSRNYYPQFSDSDFHNCDLSLTISITAGIVNLPKFLMSERAYGRHVVGVTVENAFVQDPTDGAEPCLLVRLDVSEDLDPTWNVIKPNVPDLFIINAAARQKLGFYRLGESIDSNLRWGKASALTDMTALTADPKAIVRLAQRESRNAVSSVVQHELESVTQIVGAEARKLGSGHLNPLKPGLDPNILSTAHAMVLHDGEIPLTSFGLGTKRIVALTAQHNSIGTGAILGVDEIEQGLDPHRLIRVLRHLRQSGQNGDSQTIFTTHSPYAVNFLEAKEISVVRSSDGVTSVTQVPPDLLKVQNTIRSSSHVLLGRRVIVGEGPTEVGFIRRMCELWDDELGAGDHQTTVTQGTVVSNGGGDEAMSRAGVFHSLGYATLLAMDNDNRQVDPAVATAQGLGVVVVRCSNGNCLERDIANALPFESLIAFLNIAIEIRGIDSVTASLKSELIGSGKLEMDPSTWLEYGINEIEIRKAIGAAANAGKWFKFEHGGEILAQLCQENEGQLTGTGLIEYLEAVRQFAFGTQEELQVDIA